MIGTTNSVLLLNTRLFVPFQHVVPYVMHPTALCHLMTYCAVLQQKSCAFYGTLEIPENVVYVEIMSQMIKSYHVFGNGILGTFVRITVIEESIL